MPGANGRRGIFQRMRRHFRRASVISEATRNKSIEWQIIQSYVWVLRAPQDIDGHRTCPLARYGAYEVRLLEPSQIPEGDARPFWIELYDHDRKVTLNSFQSDDLEDAAVTASTLIAEAELLHRQPSRRWWHSSRR
jgi:hypothetical protein